MIEALVIGAVGTISYFIYSQIVYNKKIEEFQSTGSTSDVEIVPIVPKHKTPYLFLKELKPQDSYVLILSESRVNIIYNVSGIIPIGTINTWREFGRYVGPYEFMEKKVPLYHPHHTLENIDLIPQWDTHAQGEDIIHLAHDIGLAKFTQSKVRVTYAKITPGNSFAVRSIRDKGHVHCIYVGYDKITAINRYMSSRGGLPLRRTALVVGLGLFIYLYTHKDKQHRGSC